MPESAKSTTWDPERYEAQHSFVWQLAEGLIDELNPQPGERILDLGCGPGHLTAKIAERHAIPVGLDSSPEMIGQARQNYPDLQFMLEDAARMPFQNEFDAVFSNAALHWMLNASGVAQAIARALRPNGRLIAELGGKGNIHAIERALDSVAARYYGDAPPPHRTFYPSIAEYAGILESHGLEVRQARLFARPTPLDGENGMENWLRQFKWFYFEPLPAGKREAALRETVEALRPVLYRDGKWSADYRRLRLAAVKTA